MEAFRHPGLFLFAAPTNSGKTTLIRFILTEMAKKGIFAYGIVLTGTAGLNNDYSYLPRKAVSVFSEDRLRAFLRMQRDLAHERGKAPPAFIVLDDVANENFKKPLYNGLFTTFRHFNLSVFVSTQYIYRIPPTIREQAAICVAFHQNTGRSKEALWQTYGTAHKKQEFYNKLDEATKEKYYALFMLNNENRMFRAKAPIVQEPIHF